MTDDELVTRFEDGSLLPGAFHHREHVRLTWLYLVRHGRPAAERRLLEGLRACASRAGKPEKFDPALTLAWIAAIDAAIQAGPPASSFDRFIASRPGLLDPRLRLQRRSARSEDQALHRRRPGATSA